MRFWVWLNLFMRFWVWLNLFMRFGFKAPVLQMACLAVTACLPAGAPVVQFVHGFLGVVEFVHAFLGVVEFVHAFRV